MQLWRFSGFVFLLMMVSPLWAQAQDSTPSGGAICVLAYNDTNENGVHDEGEAPLPDVSVHVAVEDDVIIRTYITTAQGESDPNHCFEGLSNGDYILTFADSPNHRATSQNTGDITLSGTERVRVEFGALPVSPFVEPNEVVNADEELDISTRLILSAVGTLFVILLMTSSGIIIGLLFFYR